MNVKIIEWFNRLSDPQRSKLSELRQLILESHGRFSETIKWGQPCYSINKQICYLQKTKEHVTIGFQQGAHLQDKSKLLIGEGINMRHVNVDLAGKIDRVAIANLITEAIEFDRK